MQIFGDVTGNQRLRGQGFNTLNCIPLKVRRFELKHNYDNAHGRLSGNYYSLNKVGEIKSSVELQEPTFWDLWLPSFSS